MRLTFVKAGEIVSTHGLRGDVKVLPWVDDADFLCAFDRVRIGGKDYDVEQARVQKTCALLKLSGVDSMEDAQQLRGKVVELYRADMDPELIFADELIGMQVVAEGAPIGKITDVLDYPGNKVYVVQGAREYMIPAVRQFVLSTDLDKNVMEVRLIPGMGSDED